MPAGRSPSRPRHSRNRDRVPAPARGRKLRDVRPQRRSQLPGAGQAPGRRHGRPGEGVGALVVDEPHRGRGLGAALLGQARKIFFAHGYPLVYGQIPADRPDLIAFYQRQGFEVRGPEDRLDLEMVFGIPGGIRPDRDERFFVCWNQRL
ncbi:hypothetical protein SSMG_08245 [Streptomyces sp. AA4]|nr:hypothetical protein SSMG_08245 [Streptomyces sp. AA4]